MRTRIGIALAAALQGALACAPAWAGPGVLRQFEPRPHAQDFDPRAYAGRVPRIFMDTLPVVCLQGRGSAVAAEFALTLRRSAARPADAAAARVSFWDRGIEHFAMRLWSGREAAGTITTMRWNLAALPPVGGAVLRNTGHGLRLLQGRDFSYAVSDPGSVLQATLTYRCGEDPFDFATVEPVSVIGEYGAGPGIGAGPLAEGPARARPRFPSRGDTAVGRIRRQPPFE